MTVSPTAIGYFHMVSSNHIGQLLGLYPSFFHYVWVRYQVGVGGPVRQIWAIDRHDGPNHLGFVMRCVSMSIEWP